MKGPTPTENLIIGSIPGKGSPADIQAKPTPMEHTNHERKWSYGRPRGYNKRGPNDKRAVLAGRLLE